MKSTTHANGGAVVSVPAVPAGVAVVGVATAAAVAASHLAGAVRLHGVGVNGAGRGGWRGQPSLGTPMPLVAIATATIAVAAPAGKVRTSTLDRTNKLDRKATKQFRTTVYEGPRPWKVPV